MKKLKHKIEKEETTAPSNKHATDKEKLQLIANKLGIKIEEKNTDNKYNSEAYTYEIYEGNITGLDLSGYSFYKKEIPLEVFLLQNLECLNLSKCKLKEIPIEIKQLTKLKKINLSDNRLKDFPISILSLKELESLYINKNDIKEIKLEKENTVIKRISITNNKIESVSCFSNFTNLEILDVSYNKVSVLDSAIKNKKLTHLSIAHNRIRNEVDKEGKIVSFSFSKLQGLKELDLSNNKIKEVDFKDFDSIEILKLANNNIKELHYVSSLTKAKEINLINNELENIESLLKLKNIKKLYLSENKIKYSIDLRKKYNKEIVILTETEMNNITENSENNEDKENKKFYFIMLGISVAILLVFVIFSNLLRENNIIERVFFIVLAIFSLTGTFFLFKILNSDARITGQKSIGGTKLIFEIGGAAALSLLLMYFYYKVVPPEPVEKHKNITVWVYDINNLDESLDSLNVNFGTLSTPVNGEKKKGTVSDDEIIFKNYPDEKDSIEFELRSANYKLEEQKYKINEDNTVKLFVSPK